MCIFVSVLMVCAYICMYTQTVCVCMRIKVTLVHVQLREDECTYLCVHVLTCENEHAHVLYHASECLCFLY